MSPQRKDRAWDVDKYGEFNVGEYSSGLVRKEIGASQKRRHHGNDSSWLEHIHPTDDHWLEERERGRSANDGEPEPRASRLYLVPFGEIRLGTDRRDLVKGLIPRDSLSPIHAHTRAKWTGPRRGAACRAPMAALAAVRVLGSPRALYWPPIQVLHTGASPSRSASDRSVMAYMDGY
jgi:hypothetical protein